MLCASCATAIHSSGRSSMLAAGGAGFCDGEDAGAGEGEVREDI